MEKQDGWKRRSFLRQAASVLGATQVSLPAEVAEKASVDKDEYPTVFADQHLATLAFPLGGVAAGSLSLGGRGQLRDWEIFNRAAKGNTPSYAFPAIYVKAGSGDAFARVLESRLLPPYEGQDGLGANNVPGLSRLASARFTGEYPLAEVDFDDDELPVAVTLQAFSPFIPHEPEESGLPAAVLRYHVHNPGTATAEVSIAFSIDNPVKVSVDRGGAAQQHKDTRTNEIRRESHLSGLVMHNPGLEAGHPMKGEFAIGAAASISGSLDLWRGWPSGRWWNSPMLFWDDFSADGKLEAETADHSVVGVVSQRRTIGAGESADFTFILAWRFPNRTPAWCGWSAPKGDENTIIGNHYCTRFASAWEAAVYLAEHLPELEARTRLFARSLRESTLPGRVKEAASANLSTLASTTCFRTADGEFHGFEGVDDHSGCCPGNCTHVWNYETATAHLFPTFARSLRQAAFGYSMDDAGAMHFRQLLPDGKDRSGFAAADGQMGQIMHACLDWKLSGDTTWLKSMWPRLKKALEFAWVPGGWDANRDGVLEGVQHNTYDVEFYGPNPMCGIYYLGALRAGEEMALAVGDTSSAHEYRRLFQSGSAWIDANLFNGEYFVQQIKGFAKNEIAPSLRSNMGSDDTEHPQYQVGQGCLVDQLIGQYLAEIAGLGRLVSQEHINKTLLSIFKYNYKRSLINHDTVQRTFALNNEAAIVICDYGKAERPKIPFPYFAEVMTGFEYSAAVMMIFAGLTAQGLECIANIRARYDGAKRNPWDEAECGHHYARAMASWSAIPALSGFRYDGPNEAVVAVPRITERPFRSFWSTATAWGSFSIRSSFELQVLHGELRCRSVELEASGPAAKVTLDGSRLTSRVERLERTKVSWDGKAPIRAGQTLKIQFAGAA